MNSTNRLDRERQFHNDRFGKDDSERASAGKFYYANIHANSRYYEIIRSLSENKSLLEYGCGSGGEIEHWKNFNANVTGIDISDEGIKNAKNKSSLVNYPANYYNMDAENTSFENDTFDLIVGTGILHHLDLQRSYNELSRICKKDGSIVFLEPLGHNPILNLYRHLTPKKRTIDEHPMKSKDLDLLKKYFLNVNCEYYSLLTLLSVPFRNTVVFRPLLTILRTLDNAIFKIPFLKKFAWIVIINASKPRS